VWHHAMSEIDVGGARRAGCLCVQHAVMQRNGRSRRTLPNVTSYAVSSWHRYRAAESAPAPRDGSSTPGAPRSAYRVRARRRLASAPSRIEGSQQCHSAPHRSAYAAL
jgi:hypothetical protein